MKKIKSLYFSLFIFWQKKVWSLPEFDRGMRKAFEHRAAKRLGQMFNEAKKKVTV